MARCPIISPLRSTQQRHTPPPGFNRFTTRFEILQRNENVDDGFRMAAFTEYDPHPSQLVLLLTTSLFLPFLVAAIVHPSQWSDFEAVFRQARCPYRKSTCSGLMKVWPTSGQTSRWYSSIARLFNSCPPKPPVISSITKSPTRRTFT